MSNKLPCGQTYRSFKRQKRKEYKKLRKEMDNIRYGCAYLPREAYRKLDEGMKLIEQSYEICKPWWKKA